MTDNTAQSETPASFAERMRTLIGAESVNAWAKRIGERPTLIQAYLKGSMPSIDKASKIAAATGTSILWLMNGEGPKDSREVRGIFEALEKGGYIRALERGMGLPSDYVLLPRYSVRAAAGAGAVIESERIVDYLAFKADWVRRQLGAAPASLLLIEAWGDSMEPMIRHGDLLLVDTGEPRVRDNAIYVLSVEGELVVKRVQRKLDGTLVVRSDNEAYPPEEIAAGESARLAVVGRVRWFGRSL